MGCVSDFQIIIIIGVGVVCFIAALGFGVSRVEHEACRTFCEDFGETSYYSSSYGCFCVTSDGQRYNPEMLTKEPTP